MGKDREGKYHPPKGKPSGKEGENDLNNLPPDVYLRHRNRNTHKDGDLEDRPATAASYNSRRNNTLNGTAGSVVPEQIERPLSREAFLELATSVDECSISIYMPTHKAGISVNEHQDLIQFKSLLQKAASRLEDTLGLEMIQKLMSGPGELLKDNEFWTRQSEGLAVFIDTGSCRYMHLPEAPRQEVLINHTFYVSPLIPHIDDLRHFYLLVVSKKQAKVYRGTREGLELLDIPGMPDGVGDVVHFEEKDDKKMGGRSGSRTSEYDGDGHGMADEKTNLATYMREVSRTLHETLLHAENAPLLLAGVQYLLPIYREVNHYPHLMDEVITGNHENDSATALHQTAMIKMEEYFRAAAEQAIERYANASGGGLTSSVAEDVIQAAYYGKVRDLFIRKGEHLWGTFEHESGRVKVHVTRREGDGCLLDKAAVCTIDQGGNVYLLDAVDMPANSSIAAVMRYNDSPDTGQDQ